MFKTFWSKFWFLSLSVVVVLTLMLVYGPRKSLDAKTSYTLSEARELIQSMNAEEKMRYLYNEFADLLLIALYTAWLVLVLRGLYDWGWFWLVAFLPGFFDLLETSTVIAVLWSGSLDLLYAELGTVTSLKWIFGVAMTLPIVSALKGRAVEREMRARREL